MEPGDLWIADRNFCTLGFLFGIVNRGAFFLIRQHGNVVGRLIPHYSRSDFFTDREAARAR
jgi:hypothetical protein